MLSYTNLAVAWWEPALGGDPHAVEAAWQATRGARRWLVAIPDQSPSVGLVLMEARLLDRRGESTQACEQAESFFEANVAASKGTVGAKLRGWIDTHCPKS